MVHLFCCYYYYYYLACMRIDLIFITLRARVISIHTYIFPIAQRVNMYCISILNSVRTIKSTSYKAEIDRDIGTQLTTNKKKH